MQTGRSWRQAGFISIIDYSGDPSAQEQVTRAINALSIERNLLLPEFFLKQMEESILHAVLDYTANDRKQLPPLLSANNIQVGIHLADPRLPEPAAISSARWGFFLVQKRGEQPGVRELFLDLYLYQE